MTSLDDRLTAARARYNRLNAEAAQLTGTARNTRIDCRNDALLEVRLLERAIARRPRMTATIVQGYYRTWFVETAGNGYPNTEPLTSPKQAERRLRELVEDGYAIVDPDGYCDIYDILTTPQGAEDSRDAAEGVGMMMVGRGPGDSGRGVVVAEAPISIWWDAETQADKKDDGDGLHTDVVDF